MDNISNTVTIEPVTTPLMPLIMVTSYGGGGQYPTTPSMYFNAQGSVTRASDDDMPPPRLPTETVWGEITAYRCWRVTNDGLLQSASANTVWAPGHPMHDKVGNRDVPNASGDRGVEHPSYGVHSFKDIQLAFQYMGVSHEQAAVAYGEVKIWGAVEEHDLGYRSEFATISAITALRGPVPGDRQEALTKLRSTYGV